MSQIYIESLHFEVNLSLFEWLWSSDQHCINKIKKKKYHMIRTIPKSNKQIVERGKNYTTNKYMTANFPGLVQALQYIEAGLN